MSAWVSLKKKLARAAGALGAASLAACAGAAPVAELKAPAAAPKPALWKLADEDTTIYLFGTIHLLPEGLEWRTPKLKQALDSADELVLETQFGTDLAKTGQTMMALGMSPGQPPLIERVPAAKRAALAAAIKDSKVPPKLLDRMETWAAALTLLAASMRSMGFEAERGVEMGLEADHRAGKKPVKGLETVEQQFGFFDTLSEEAQRAFLVGTLEDGSATKAQFEAMLKAWAAGDTDAIARTFDSETALSPELRKVLMTERNTAWADWLAKRLEQPGTVMVAVGAGHLAGSDSVQRMLARRGLETERVQ